MTHKRLINFKKRCSKIPVFGGLFLCQKKDFMNSSQEFGWNVLWSFSPLLIAIFVLFFTREADNFDFINNSINLIKNGELFLYCTSLVAPIFYIILDERPGLLKYPSKKLQTGLFIVLMGIAGLFFTLKRAGIQFYQSSITDFSFVYLFICLVYLFITLVYKNYRQPDPSSAIREEEEDFSSQAESHRRGK